MTLSDRLRHRESSHSPSTTTLVERIRLEPIQYQNHGTCFASSLLFSSLTDLCTSSSPTQTPRPVLVARRMARRMPSPDPPVLRFGMWTAENSLLANALSMSFFLTVVDVQLVHRCQNPTPLAQRVRVVRRGRCSSFTRTTRQDSECAYRVSGKMVCVLTNFDSDPYVVLILSLTFIGSIFFLHISAKMIRSFTK